MLWNIHVKNMALIQEVDVELSTGLNILTGETGAGKSIIIGAVNVALGCALELVGEENISRLLLSGSVLQPLLSGLLGFIPNCAASVILTELYLGGSLSFGAAVAGLCTGAGLGLLVLFRVNKNWRENLCIAGVLYVSAVVTGTLCQLILP